MLLFVGLGNPGEKYRNHRHNIGYMAIDQIHNAVQCTPWKVKFRAKVSETHFGTQKVLMLKPETFMNLSGQSVREALHFYKMNSKDIIVFHDELDLAPGKCRAKTTGGHGGHNGLRSIHQNIGAEYTRIRLGIGHPGDKELVPSYVLNDFAKSDLEWLALMLESIAGAADLLAYGDTIGFMNKVAMRSDWEKGVKPSNKKKVLKAKSSLDKSIKNLLEADDRTSFQKLIDRFR